MDKLVASAMILNGCMFSQPLKIAPQLPPKKNKEGATINNFQKFPLKKPYRYNGKSGHALSTFSEKIM